MAAPPRLRRELMISIMDAIDVMRECNGSTATEIVKCIREAFPAARNHKKFKPLNIKLLLKSAARVGLVRQKGHRFKLNLDERTSGDGIKHYQEDCGVIFSKKKNDCQKKKEKKKACGKRRPEKSSCKKKKKKSCKTRKKKNTCKKKKTAKSCGKRHHRKSSCKKKKKKTSRRKSSSCNKKKSVSFCLEKQSHSSKNSGCGKKKRRRRSKSSDCSGEKSSGCSGEKTRSRSKSSGEKSSGDDCKPIKCKVEVEFAQEEAGHPSFIKVER